MPTQTGQLADDNADAIFLLFYEFKTRFGVTYV